MKQKFFKTFFCAFLTISLMIISQASAMSIGRVGEPYVENGTKWQPTRYAEDKVVFTAAFPGEPRSGISNGYYFMHSRFGHSDYEINTSASDRFVIPKSAKAFRSEVREALGKEHTYTIMKTDSKAVVYTVEVKMCDEAGNINKMVRLYLTKDERLYNAIVEGDDFSLANEFFSKIKFS